jgi:hypothetical protein
MEFQDHYNISFHNYNKRVTNVVNKGYGNVQFLAIEMDESSGFVHGSAMKIWTNVPNKDMLNIVHVHLNDTSESVSIDLRYL